MNGFISSYHRAVGVMVEIDGHKGSERQERAPCRALVWPMVRNRLGERMNMYEY